MTHPANNLPKAGVMLDMQRHLQLQQSLFFEARLLDEERFQDWLQLLAPDIHYQMPQSVRKFRNDRSPEPPFGEGFIFNEDINRLQVRIKRLQSGYVWTEDPRNHVRRLVSNVEIYQTAKPDEAGVFSAISIQRNRIDGQQRILNAGRRDIWRETADGWRLAKRDTTLDHSTIPDTNLNVFF